MSKIVLNNTNLPPIISRKEEQGHKVIKSQTVANKVNIVLAVWGIIFAFLGLGMVMALLSFGMACKYLFKGKISTSSKWAKYTSIVSIIVNAIFLVLV